MDKKAEIEKVVEILRDGGVILYPTETVWGLGCDATNAEAVRRLFSLKKREDHKAMIVLVESTDVVARYVREVPEVAWELWEASDSPMTLILPGGVGVAKNLLPAEGTIAIRLAGNDFCRQVTKRLGRPLVSTSANISGKATPTEFDDIAAEITQAVDHIADRSWATGATGLSSSIIALGLGGEIKIIRR